MDIYITLYRWSGRTRSTQTQSNSSNTPILLFHLILNLLDRFKVFDSLDSQFKRRVLTISIQSSSIPVNQKASNPVRKKRPTTTRERGYRRQTHSHTTNAHGCVCKALAVTFEPSCQTHNSTTQPRLEGSPPYD